jgi:hypothetical protein
MTPSTRGRGFALAATRALGPAAAARFCRLAAPTAGDAAETLALHAGRLGDAAARADEARALGRSEPAGVSRTGGGTQTNGADETMVPTIDRSWFQAPPASTSAAGTAHLERLAYGQLVSMPSGADGATGDEDEAAQLLRRTPDEIERVLMALGRRRVALAFVAAPRAGLAQLCARIGEPAASELVAEVREVKAVGAGHEDVKAAQRALFRGDDGELGGAGGLDEADALFFRVGAAWLGPALGRRGDQLRRLAQRLPRPLGQTLLDEATAFATEAERTAAVTQLANTLRGAL